MLRRKRPLLPDGVPVELLDLDHAVWQSESLYESWLEDHGLDRHRVTYGPVSRHHDGACAFSIRAGSYRTYGPSSWPWPDLSFLTNLGVPIYSRRAEHSARSRLERLLKET